MRGKRKYKKLIVILLSLTVLLQSTGLAAYGADVSTEGKWIQKEGSWYFCDNSKNVKTGWIFVEGYWYFLNTQPYSANGKMGEMLTGWQWINGKCYYLAENMDITHPEGAMYENSVTPDGYSVEISGAWVDENGLVKYEAGKGIQTGVNATAKLSSKSSGGGSGNSQSRTKSGSKKKEQEESAFSSDGQTEERKEVKENNEESEVQNSGNHFNENYSYTVRYLEINDKTVLGVLTTKGEAKAKIEINPPDIEGYEICQGQKESFILSSDGMVINIYYSQSKTASPSEAKSVSWKLYFVEEDNRSNEILKSQSGSTPEGNELVIDFPETVLGADKYYYHSLVSSPWSQVVSGTGTQKYYIEFEKGESLPKEEDPDQEPKAVLEEWLTAVRTSDFKITGETPLDSQIITESLKESNERLLNLVSMADGADRKEVYLIAKNHTPSTAIINQTFDDVINISELVMDEFEISGDSYLVIRIGFEKTYEEETCVHDYEVVERVDSTCIESGYETVRCTKCKKEETYLLPAPGHTDGDGDEICDICYESAGEEPEAIHYQIGDIQARTIGGRIYLFRCIDDDYEDAMENSQQTALFLCDRIIRSDVDGAANKLTFGSNNNYKRSNIREWLQDNAEDNRFLENTYIGITRSYMGATAAGTYEQFDENSLTGYDRLYQSMEDKIFILSVEEAIKYRDYLWKFNGSEENNPESQISAYSKGYYLRTPQDTGTDEFQYGNGIYGVSLTLGNIRPVEVRDSGMGIRPVMAVPQG